MCWFLVAVCFVVDYTSENWIWTCSFLDDQKSKRNGSLRNEHIMDVAKPHRLRDIALKGSLKQNTFIISSFKAPPPRIGELVLPIKWQIAFTSPYPYGLHDCMQRGWPISHPRKDLLPAILLTQTDRETLICTQNRQHTQPNCQTHFDGCSWAVPLRSRINRPQVNHVGLPGFSGESSLLEGKTRLEPLPLNQDGEKERQKPPGDSMTL